MRCSLCGGEERGWIGDKHKKYIPGPNVVEFVCSTCVAKTYQVDKTELERLAATAKKRGLGSKSDWFSIFLRG